MTALLAEYNDKPLNALDTTGDFDDYLFAKKRYSRASKIFK